MSKHDQISSAIFFVFGLLIVLYAPQYGLGTLGTPGSGLMPLFCGLVICWFSASVFVTATLRRSRKKEAIWGKISYRKIIFTILVIVTYTLTLNWLGFLICSFLLMLILFRWVGNQSWLRTVVGAVLSSTISYLVFVTWLKCQLPGGILRL